MTQIANLFLLIHVVMVFRVMDHWTQMVEKFAMMEIKWVAMDVPLIAKQLKPAGNAPFGVNLVVYFAVMEF